MERNDHADTVRSSELIDLGSASGQTLGGLEGTVENFIQRGAGISDD